MSNSPLSPCGNSPHLLITDLGKVFGNSSRAFPTIVSSANGGCLGVGEFSSGGSLSRWLSPSCNRVILILLHGTVKEMARIATRRVVARVHRMFGPYPVSQEVSHLMSATQLSLKDDAAVAIAASRSHEGPTGVGATGGIDLSAKAIWSSPLSHLVPACTRAGTAFVGVLVQSLSANVAELFDRHDSPLLSTPMFIAQEGT
jgi:hypothetical protein